jgi:hypothetical protein
LEYKLAEIAVSNNENPLLSPGNCKDVLIGKTRGKVSRDGLNVVSEVDEVRNKSLSG